MHENRIEWIDGLKSLALFLVVWGHFLDGGVVKTLIYSFHVPLFFMISGFLDAMCYKGRRLRLKALLLPYVVWVVVSYLFWLCIKPPTCSIVRSLIPIDGFALWNHPLWFLWTLFWVQALSPRLSEVKAMFSLSLSKCKATLLTIILFVCFVALDFALGGMNILAYRQVGLGVVFYEIGAVVVRCNVLALIDAHKLVLLLCVPLGLVAAIANGGVSIFAWYIRNAFLLLTSATCLSLAVMWSARKIRAIRLLNFRVAGMLLLCSHYYPMLF